MSLRNATSASPESIERIALMNLDMAKELREIRTRLASAEEVLAMVEENTKMPHQHTDPQLRLYCLAERAREHFSKFQDATK
jgi:hypothetical protein